MSKELEPDLDEVQDLRFARIEAELYAIKELDQAMERQLPLTVKSEVGRLESELDAASDEYERHGIEQWILEFTEEVLPRSFRGPLLVMLWALFESAIIEIAEVLRTEGNHELRIDDLRAGGFLEKADKYFKLVLRFPLTEVESTIDPLRMLLTVRNAMAHANGRLEFIKATDIQKIDAWEKSRVGLSTDYGSLTFSAAFVERMIDAVTFFLEDLIRRAKAL